MVLKILKYPDPFLKTKTRPVEKVDGKIRSVIDDMVETMYSARGIGLAAPQTGADLRIIVLDVPEFREDDEQDDKALDRKRGENLMALVNPEIIEAQGSTSYDEGCLSIPGFTADVGRYSDITVRALDRDGKKTEFSAQGLLAIALQHEIDHLDGILFIDRLSRLKKEIIKRKIKKALEAQEHAL